MMTGMLEGQMGQVSPEEEAAMLYIVKKLNERADELEASTDN